VGSICHRIDFYQHFWLYVLIGCQVGSTTTPPHRLNVFVELSQTAAEGRVKLVFDCVVINAKPGGNSGPLVAYICYRVPSWRCRAKSCCSWPFSHLNAIFFIRYYYNGSGGREDTSAVGRWLLVLLRMRGGLVGTASRGPLRHSISSRMRPFQKDSL
jgi:hypothetical protein